MASPKKRVLVVDDTDSMRMLVVAVLSKNKRLEIDSAANATEAMAKVRASKPSLIVLDMMLPEMSGMEFIEKLHSEVAAPLPAIIAMTAAPQVAAPDAVIKAADASIVRAVFRKPFDQEKLAAAVAQYAE